ncbi:chemotaxis protein CheA [Parapedomonas caeni]
MTANDPTAVFLTEAQELLEQLEQSLLDLHGALDDSDLIDGAFRALHTIKGSGSMFGFDAVAAFTHHVETAFDLVRKGHLATTPALIDVALAARDHIRRLIETPDVVDPQRGPAILADLDAVIADGGETDATSTPTTAPIAARHRYRICIKLPEDALTTGNNPLLLLDELRALGEAEVTAIVDDVPTLDALQPDVCTFGWVIELETEAPKSAIEDVFLFLLDDMTLDIEESAVPSPVAPVAPTVVEPAIPAASVAAPAAPVAANDERHSDKATASLRVSAERLDELMDRVGELVIAQARLRQVATHSDDQQVKSIAEEIERLVLDLRDTTMGIRLVPIGSLFGRFRRLVHDLSRDLGKDVVLTTSGEETELDKTVIDRLADPLVHLIRNAIDHGLEYAADRSAAGKAASGSLKLAARHAGDRILITISDDGRGLDRARIRRRAEENGLIAPEAELTDPELLQLIFQPGFSTAAQVTNVSGRGVGMDVVKKTIETLRGAIDVRSRPGAGTDIVLSLPLTLAIIDGLLVRIGTGRYVIPLSAVEECVELTPDDDRRSQGRNFLNIRGDLVPFLRLRELFNLSTPPDPYQKVVVVSSGDNRVGLVVDQVLGDHQTVIKSLSKLHANVATFSGATILGDGTCALILEVDHLVQFGQALEERLKAAS